MNFVETLKFNRLTKGIYKAAQKRLDAANIDPQPPQATRLRFLPTPKATTAAALVLVGVAALIILLQFWRSPSVQVPASSLGGLGAKLSAPPTSQAGVPAEPVSATALPTGQSTGFVDGPQLLLPGADGQEIMVYLTGEVNHPGTVRLPVNSRLTDALALAGGPTNQAELSEVNLARLVKDGEHIHFPKPGEAPARPELVSHSSGGEEPQDNTPPIDLNTASRSELESLPGIGPALAQRITDYRSKHGRFGSIEELKQVSGIGTKLLSRLSQKVKV